MPLQKGEAQLMCHCKGNLIKCRQRVGHNQAGVNLKCCHKWTQQMRVGPNKTSQKGSSTSKISTTHYGPYMCCPFPPLSCIIFILRPLQRVQCHLENIEVLLHKTRRWQGRSPPFFFFFLESIYVRLGVQNPMWHFEDVHDRKVTRVLPNCSSFVSAQSPPHRITPEKQ